MLKAMAKTHLTKRNPVIGVVNVFILRLVVQLYTLPVITVKSKNTGKLYVDNSLMLKTTNLILTS